MFIDETRFDNYDLKVKNQKKQKNNSERTDSDLEPSTIKHKSDNNDQTPVKTTGL